MYMYVHRYHFQWTAIGLFTWRYEKVYIQTQNLSLFFFFFFGFSATFIC